MKYNFEWFIVGLILFWIVETIAYFSNHTTHLHPYMEFGLPLFMWIGGSILDYQLNYHKKNEN